MPALAEPPEVRVSPKRRRELVERSPATERSGEGHPRRALQLSLVLAGLVAIVVPVYWLFVMREDGPPALRISTAAATEVVYEDFVGAETCEECHETQYNAWLNSTHQKAGGRPTTDLIIARFDGSPIRFADAIVRPIVGSDSSYRFVVEQEGFQAETLTVAGVIGGGHMVGGGTQGFVSEFPDGTVRFLPFDFIRHESVWFCNTNSRSNKGWIPIL